MLHFDLPLWPCLAVIAASVAMNLNCHGAAEAQSTARSAGRAT